MTAPGMRARRAQLEVYLSEKRATLDSRPLRLTPKEYQLLAALAMQAGQTVSAHTLLEAVWGYRSGACTRTFTVHLCRLRKKLAAAGADCIETVLGVGVRLNEERVTLRR